ncbi:MAG TPA: histidine kinase dimerization/phosphoacceptor domain -containing protein, partial [Cyclobacteriaceae bacterium]|nr:histidine kinase dimerization/phosphoacceptor domain -containing protein [Cyclobacteriaceae bacterium]
QLEALVAQSIVLIDSLKRELSSAKGPLEKMDLYYYLSEAWAESNFDSAIYYAENLYRLAESENNEEYRIYGLRLKGNAFDYQYNYDSARYYYELTLDHAIALQDSAQIGVAYFNLGTLFLLAGKYVQALPYYENALIFYETKPAKEQNIWKIYNNLGIIYRRTKRYNDAISTYRKAIKILDVNSNDRRLTNLYINIANAYSSLKQYDSVAHYFNKVLSFTDFYQDKYNSYYAYNGLGILSFEENRLADAKRYFRPVALDTSIEDDNLKITAFGYLGAISTIEKNFGEAERYFNEAMKFNDEERFPDQAKGFYGQLVAFYEAKLDFKTALIYLKKYNELNDELLNNEVIDRTAEWEERYKTQEKEKEIMALRFTNQQAALLAEQRNNERNIFIVSTFFLALLAVVIGFLYQSRKRANQLLTQKNEVVQKTLKEKELLMKEIHHRVKNNLQVVSSLLNMQTYFIADQQASAAVMESKNRVYAMSLIHQSLYQTDDVTEVNIAEYFEQLLANLESAYQDGTKDIEIQTDIQELAVDVDIAIPLGLIVNELVSNAYKHAFKNRTSGFIKIDFQLIAGNYHLKVADDGEGNKGDKLERKKSLGMVLIQDLSRKLKAELRIETLHGVSTSMIFPVKAKSTSL